MCEKLCHIFQNETFDLPFLQRFFECSIHSHPGIIEALAETKTTERLTWETIEVDVTDPQVGMLSLAHVLVQNFGLVIHLDELPG